MLKNIFFILIFFSLSSKNAFAQGWERIYGATGNDIANAIAATPDGGTVSAGVINLFNMYIIRTDIDGDIIWQKNIEGIYQSEARAIITLPDGGFIVAGYIDGTGLGGKDVYLVRLSSNGNILWTKNLGTTLDDEAYDIKLLPDGGFIIAGYSDLENLAHNFLLIRTDAEGNELWQNHYGGNYDDEARSVAISADGGFIATGIYSLNETNKSIYVLKTKPDGTQQWGTFYGFGAKYAGNAIIANSDTTYVVAGSYGLNEQQLYLMKIDAGGIKIWERFYGEGNADEFAYGLTKTIEGGYVAAGYADVFGGSKAYVVWMDSEGNSICERKFGKTGNGINEIPISFGNAITLCTDGYYAIAGLTNSNINAGFDDNIFLIKVDACGNTRNSLITGSIFSDINNNCEQNLNETPLQGWTVKLTKNSQTVFATSNATGTYAVSVDSGAYAVTLISPNDYWQPCVSTYNVNINNNYDTLKLPYAVYTQTSCPYMTVNIATGNLQNCANNTYSVNYNNLGTYPALGAFIEITFDDDLEITNSSLPWSFQNGNSYIFNIGNVFPGQSGNFQINTFLNCDALLGATHCATAHIYPDSLCNTPSELWDGASIELNTYCDGDSVRFIIKNVGLNALSPTNELKYIVIEDQIIGLQGIIPPLAANDSIEVAVSAQNGSTFRMIADQSPGHPGNSHPTVAIEGCETDSLGNTSIGYINMFSENDADPFIDIDCQESTDFVTDFNKRGYPKGYNADYFISPTTDLEYIIDFKNTTLDTVHSVVIVDTLDTTLDPTTVEWGSASHPYVFQLYGNGILRWTLNDINLLPNESGFVKFRIAQKMDNNLGSIINNKATVFYDYGTPNFTDITKHTVGENFVEVISQTTMPTSDLMKVKVFPNPFTQSTTFLLDNLDEDMLFELYDMYGQLVRSEKVNELQYHFERGSLSAGMYLFKISNRKGKQLSIGRIIIQ